MTTGTITTIDFHRDTLFAVERDDGVHMMVTPICKSLGISPDRQRDRIQRDPVLSEGATMMVAPSPGGAQETFCLRLDLVHGWLFTIDESRVKDEETRQRVLTYKRECYKVLFRHFHGTVDRTAPERVAEPSEGPEGPRLRLVTETRQTFGVRAAQQVWFRVGLPIVPAMLHDQQQGDLLGYQAMPPGVSAH